ncbi:MAG: DNA polymerase III subunit beta [Rhodobacteraceae bacterium]|nr:DNA polymerase III subunit beta [Paracoccaceae bacterium]
MIFSIDTEKLLYIMSRISQVIDRKPASPVLGNALFRAEGSTVSIRATDLNSTVIASLDCSVGEEGQATIPIERMRDIARALQNDSQTQITYDSSNQKLNISSGMTNYVLTTVSIADFPTIDFEDFVTSFEVSMSSLKRIFDKTKYAISDDESRMHLNGVYLHNQGEGDARMLTGVAIDGFQMSVVKSTMPDGADEMEGVIVSAKAVNDITRLFADKPEVTLSVNKYSIMVQSDEITYITRLIEGIYPKYEKLLPDDMNARIVVNAKTLMTAINRVSTIVSDGDCRISFELKDDNLLLSASAFGCGNSSDSIPVECNSDDLKTRFTSHSLTNVLSLIGDHEATFLFSDKDRAVMVLDNGDEHSTYIVMPSR